MRTTATKQPSHQDSVHQKPVRATPVPVARSLSTVSPASAMLQRKPGCACGGGCPRCQEQGLLQTKLKISEPGDEYEQEADLIADRVMRMPEPSVQRQMESEEDEEEGMVQRQAISGSITPLVQRQVSPDIEEEEEEVIQTKTIDDRAAPSDLTQESSEVPPTVHEVLRSPGQPLDPETRTFMEPRFGQDFSQVRVHTDEKAAESAQAVSALAYTMGQDIVFGSGQFQPQTGGGQHLLAHELTHVVQQGAASSLQQAKLADQSIYREKSRRDPKTPAKKASSCPTFVSMTATVKPDSAVSETRPGHCRLELGHCPTPRGQCGSSKTSGAILNATVDIPEGCTGELAFAQNLLSVDRRYIRINKTEECLTTSSPHSDGGRPWKGCVLSVTKAGKYTLETDDCPSIVLEDTMTAASAKDSFKMYLLWKESGEEARVAIANVTWSWNASTTSQKGKDCISKWAKPAGTSKGGKGEASTDKFFTEPDLKNLKKGKCGK